MGNNHTTSVGEPSTAVRTESALFVVLKREVYQHLPEPGFEGAADLVELLLSCFFINNKEILGRLDDFETVSDEELDYLSTTCRLLFSGPLTPDAREEATDDPAAGATEVLWTGPSGMQPVTRPGNVKQLSRREIKIHLGSLLQTIPLHRLESFIVRVMADKPPFSLYANVRLPAYHVALPTLDCYTAAGRAAGRDVDVDATLLWCCCVPHTLPDEIDSTRANVFVLLRNAYRATHAVLPESCRATLVSHFIKWATACTSATELRPDTMQDLAENLILLVDDVASAVCPAFRATWAHVMHLEVVPRASGGKSLFSGADGAGRGAVRYAVALLTVVLAVSLDLNSRAPRPINIKHVLLLHVLAYYGVLRQLSLFMVREDGEGVRPPPAGGAGDLPATGSTAALIQAYERAAAERSAPDHFVVVDRADGRPPERPERETLFQRASRSLSMRSLAEPPERIMAASLVPERLARLESTLSRTESAPRLTMPRENLRTNKRNVSGGGSALSLSSMSVTVTSAASEQDASSDPPGSSIVAGLGERSVSISTEDNSGDGGGSGGSAGGDTLPPEISWDDFGDAAVNRLVALLVRPLNLAEVHQATGNPGSFLLAHFRAHDVAWLAGRAKERLVTLVAHSRGLLMADEEGIACVAAEGVWREWELVNAMLTSTADAVRRVLVALVPPGASAPAPLGSNAGMPLASNGLVRNDPQGEEEVRVLQAAEDECLRLLVRAQVAMGPVSAVLAAAVGRVLRHEVVREVCHLDGAEETPELRALWQTVEVCLTHMDRLGCADALQQTPARTLTAAIHALEGAVSFAGAHALLVAAARARELALPGPPTPSARDLPSTDMWALPPSTLPEHLDRPAGWDAAIRAQQGARAFAALWAWSAFGRSVVEGWTSVALLAPLARHAREAWDGGGKACRLLEEPDVAAVTYLIRRCAVGGDEREEVRRVWLAARGPRAAAVATAALREVDARIVTCEKVTAMCAELLARLSPDGAPPGPTPPPPGTPLSVEAVAARLRAEPALAVSVRMELADALAQGDPTAAVTGLLRARIVRAQASAAASKTRARLLHALVRSVADPAGKIAGAMEAWLAAPLTPAPPVGATAAVHPGGHPCEGHGSAVAGSEEGADTARVGTLMVLTPAEVDALGALPALAERVARVAGGEVNVFAYLRDVAPRVDKLAASLDEVAKQGIRGALQRAVPPHELLARERPRSMPVRTTRNGYDRVSVLNSAAEALRSASVALAGCGPKASAASEAAGRAALLYAEAATALAGMDAAGDDAAVASAVVARATLEGAGRGWSRFVTDEAARAMAPFDADGNKAAHGAVVEGRHIHTVARTGGVFFKTLDPPEASYDGDWPAMEYVASELAAVFTRVLPLSTALLRLSVPQGSSRSLLVSPAVPGIPLTTLLDHYPHLVAAVEPENFSECFVLGVLADFGDAKPDNYMCILALPPTDGALPRRPPPPPRVQLVPIDRDQTFVDALFRTGRVQREVVVERALGLEGRTDGFLVREYGLAVEDGEFNPDIVVLRGRSCLFSLPPGTPFAIVDPADGKGIATTNTPTSVELRTHARTPSVLFYGERRPGGGVVGGRVLVVDSDPAGAAVRVLNVVYCLPQMDAPLAPHCAANVTRLGCSDVMIWLGRLQRHASTLADMRTRGVLSADDYARLNLPLRLVPGTARRLFTRLCALQGALANGAASHYELLRAVEPTVALWYRHVVHRALEDHVAEFAAKGLVAPDDADLDVCRGADPAVACSVVQRAFGTVFDAAQQGAGMAQFGLALSEDNECARGAQEADEWLKRRTAEPLDELADFVGVVPFASLSPDEQRRALVTVVSELHDLHARCPLIVRGASVLGDPVLLSRLAGVAGPTLRLVDCPGVTRAGLLAALGVPEGGEAETGGAAVLELGLTCGPLDLADWAALACAAPDGCLRLVLPPVPPDPNGALHEGAEEEVFVLDEARVPLGPTWRQVDFSRPGDVLNWGSLTTLMWRAAERGDLATTKHLVALADRAIAADPLLARAPLAARAAFVDGAHRSSSTTPLQAAVDRRAELVAVFLLSCGASTTPPSRRWSCLPAAARQGMVGVVDALLDAGKARVDVPDYEGFFPLHYAVANARHAVVAALLRKRPYAPVPPAPPGPHSDVPPIDRIAPDGSIPLEVAVRLPDAPMVRLLLAFGAQINTVNARGETALHLAGKCGHPDMVEELIKAGANVDARDHRGKTPAMLALERGYQAVFVALADPRAGPYLTAPPMPVPSILAALERARCGPALSPAHMAPTPARAAGPTAAGAPATSVAVGLDMSRDAIPSLQTSTDTSMGDRSMSYAVSESAGPSADVSRATADASRADASSDGDVGESRDEVGESRDDVGESRDEVGESRDEVGESRDEPRDDAGDEGPATESTRESPPPLDASESAASLSSRAEFRSALESSVALNESNPGLDSSMPALDATGAASESDAGSRSLQASAAEAVVPDVSVLEAGVSRSRAASANAPRSRTASGAVRRQWPPRGPLGATAQAALRLLRVADARLDAKEYLTALLIYAEAARMVEDERDDDDGCGSGGWLYWLLCHKMERVQAESLFVHHGAKTPQEFQGHVAAHRAALRALVALWAVVPTGDEPQRLEQYSRGLRTLLEDLVKESVELLRGQAPASRVGIAVLGGLGREACFPRSTLQLAVAADDAAGEKYARALLADLQLRVAALMETRVHLTAEGGAEVVAGACGVSMLRETRMIVVAPPLDLPRRLLDENASGAVVLSADFISGEGSLRHEYWRAAMEILRRERRRSSEKELDQASDAFAAHLALMLFGPVVAGGACIFDGVEAHVFCTRVLDALALAGGTLDPARQSASQQLNDVIRDTDVTVRTVLQRCIRTAAAFRSRAAYDPTTHQALPVPLYAQLLALLVAVRARRFKKPLKASDVATLDDLRRAAQNQRGVPLWGKKQAPVLTAVRLMPLDSSQALRQAAVLGAWAALFLRESRASHLLSSNHIAASEVVEVRWLLAQCYTFYRSASNRPQAGVMALLCTLSLLYRGEPWPGSASQDEGAPWATRREAAFQLAVCALEECTQLLGTSDSLPRVRLAGHTDVVQGELYVRSPVVPCCAPHAPPDAAATDDDARALLVRVAGDVVTRCREALGEASIISAVALTVLGDLAADADAAERCYGDAVAHLTQLAAPEKNVLFLSLRSEIQERFQARTG